MFLSSVGLILLASCDRELVWKTCARIDVKASQKKNGRVEDAGEMEIQQDPSSKPPMVGLGVDCLTAFRNNGH